MPRLFSKERLVDTFIPLFIAVLVGLGSSAQIAMIGGMARLRSAPESTFTSMMATLAGIALVLAFRAFRGDPLQYFAPLDRGITFVVIALVATALLVMSMKGLNIGYAATGLFATVFLLGTAALVPTLGVALFFGATTAGSIIGAVIFDQIGAFGAQPTPLSLMRIIGVLTVFAGVIIVRLAK
ncbi:MAG: DMT family transporter [Chloroflexota bacterium]